MRLDDRPGIALSTDGVGSKVIVAEELGRFDTVGIDCIAMNVNDVICVGAEPLAVLDYIAVEEADPEQLRQIGGAQGRRRGRRRRDPRRRARAASGAHPRPPLAAWLRPGRRLLRHRRARRDRLRRSHRARRRRWSGFRRAGVHSNGSRWRGGRCRTCGARPRPSFGGESCGEALLEPTVIYVRAVLDLLGSGADVRGLAHITERGPAEPAAARGGGGLPDRRPAAACRPSSS